MLGIQERLQKAQDRRHFVSKKALSAEVAASLKPLTQGLDVDERIVFSSSYRRFRGVPTPDDYSLFEAAGEETEKKFSSMLVDFRKINETLTPDTLWSRIPNIDPHRENRAEIKKAALERTTEPVTVIDLREEVPSFIPQGVAA